MSKGLVGLVAYGDSDSDSSDDEQLIVPPAKAPASGTTTSGMSTQNTPFRPLAFNVSIDAGSKEPKTGTDQQGQDRPSPQDTISRPGGARPGSDTNKSLSIGLLKHTLEAEHSKEHLRTLSSDSIHTSSPSIANEAHGTSFVRSHSGTPLPADHSAAADVYNTPTTGMSPVASQPSRMNESRQETGATFHGDRGALMRSLLRPRPIPGAENFGIPPSPEGEINPTVQAKMEQFQNIKVTRGIHFNQSLMKNKNFRNPHIYSSLVDLVALNEIGSNFEKKEFFDFEGYGPECYAAGLAEAQKQAAERLAVQQQARSQLQFVPGSTSTTSNQSGGMEGVISSASGSLGSVPSSVASAAAAAAAIAARHASSSGPSARHKKSKWDSVAVDEPHKKSRH
ncbi:hypothetical protein BGZ82_005096 [Podila clonocystis]|nr:hypothetical protein BGZ82_005096 [Podila clonocystis]